MQALHRAPLIYKLAIYQIKSPHNELVSRLKCFFFIKKCFQGGAEIQKKIFFNIPRNMLALHSAPLIYKPAMYQIKSPHNEQLSCLKCFFIKKFFQGGAENFEIIFLMDRVIHLLCKELTDFTKCPCIRLNLFVVSLFGIYKT